MCAIFYMHQTSGACAGMCTCDHMHQMEKTAYEPSTKFWINIFLSNMVIPCFFLEEMKDNCVVAKKTDSVYILNKEIKRI